MEDDESKKHTVDTVPPPADAEDAYSAETKVGMASAELLELVRRAEEGALGAARASPAPPKPVSAPPKAASTPPPPRPASTPPPPPKAASTPPPAPKAKTASVRPAPHAVDTPRSPRVRAEPERQPSGLPPFVSIPLVFLAATIVLAALAR